jgi:hypothetical protein
VKIFTSSGLEAAWELLAYSKLSEGYKKGLFHFRHACTNYILALQEDGLDNMHFLVAKVHITYDIMPELGTLKYLLLHHIYPPPLISIASLNILIKSLLASLNIQILISICRSSHAQQSVRRGALP